MRLLWLAILIAPCAFGQDIQYATSIGGAYQKLDTAVLPSGAKINIRVLPCPTTKGWQFSTNDVPDNLENICPIEYRQDNLLAPFDDGVWTVKATDGTTKLSATFTVAGQPSPPITTLVDWSLTWTAVITDTEGRSISGVTYRLETSPASSGPWTSAWTGSTTTATVKAGDPQYFRVFAILSNVESLPSNVVFGSKPLGAPPDAPVVVGGQKRVLALVSGASTGMRAVYSRTSTGSRGPKIGDLSVGPTNGDFARIECDVADSFTYGGNRYARVKTPIDGWVSGCYSVGEH